MFSRINDVIYKSSFFYLSDHRTTGYKVSVHSTWAKTKLETPLIYWSHWCFTFEEYSDSWVIYKNGVRSAEGQLPPYEGPLDPAGAYIIG